MSGRDQLNFLRLVECPGSLDDFYLFRVDGREMLSTPFEFRLTIRSRGEIPQANAWVGALVTFVIGPSEDTHRKISGRCVRFEHAYQKGAFVEFVLDVSAAVSTLRFSRTSRIFTQKSVKQVLGQLLAEHNVAFDDSKVKGASDTREYIVQYNESDFDFVSRLMEREGVFYYFLQDEGAGAFKHKMVLADDASGFFDGDPFMLSFRRDVLLMGLEDMSTAYVASTGAWTTHDYDYKSPKSLTPAKTATRLDYLDKSTSTYEWPGGGPAADGVRARSKLGMEEAEAASLIIEGSGSYVGFTPGARYEIDDTRLITRERRIAIRSVTHSAWDPWELEEGEASYHQSFSAVPSQQTYRPPSVTPPAIVRGPQTGVVIDQNDGEGFGRVKVRLHWDVAGTSTCWLRVAQQWGGGQIGAQFIPREGMEVVVDFLDGDPDRPLVTGCVYNGDNKHPFDVPANLSQAGWRTKSHPSGDVVNVFQFEDKSGAEEIYTYAGRNLRRETINDESVDIHGQSHIHVGKDQDTKIDGGESVTVGQTSTTETGADFKVHAHGVIELDADGSGRMHSLGQVTVSSEQGISLRVGASTVSITPSGITITGPLVQIN